MELDESSIDIRSLMPCAWIIELLVCNLTTHPFIHSSIHPSKLREIALNPQEMQRMDKIDKRWALVDNTNVHQFVQPCRTETPSNWETIQWLFCWIVYLIDWFIIWFIDSLIDMFVGVFKAWYACNHNKPLNGGKRLIFKRWDRWWICSLLLHSHFDIWVCSDLFDGTLCKYWRDKY